MGSSECWIEHSILLTPHQCVPETDIQAVIDNEHSSLRYGVYNLGFLAVKMTGQGTTVHRLVGGAAQELSVTTRSKTACSRISAGLTWRPAFFDDIGDRARAAIQRGDLEPDHRRATGRAPYEIEINGKPLVFYHFSGFDSGAQKAMLDRYGSHSPVLFELRDWYIARCEELGQSTLSKINCIYNSFSNGERDHQPRSDLLYRRRDDLMRTISRPI